jgi:hypothetical protein
MNELAQSFQDVGDDQSYGIEFGPGVLDAPEYYWLSFLGCLVKYRDDEGRPLGEGTAPAKYLRGVPMEMKTCPYSGTRYHHPLPMNVSALRQVSAHWPSVLGGMAVLSERYARYLDRPRAQPSRTDLWKLTRLGLMLPAYLLRRARRPLRGGQIPAAVAVIYKIMLGLNRIADVQTLLGFASGLYDQLPPWTPEHIAQFTERNDLFIGRHSVCAGTPQMAEDTFRVMLGGSVPHSAEPALMEELLDEEAVPYFNVLMEFEVEKYLFGIRSTFLLHDLYRGVQAAPPNPTLSLDCVEGWIAESNAVSTLAGEIATADEDARARVIAGLERLRAELRTERAKIGIAGPAEPPALGDAARSSIALERSVAFLRRVLPATAIPFPLIEILLAYAYLERTALARFECFQERIDVLLGHDARPFRLQSADVRPAFGPKLPDFAAALIGIRFENVQRRLVLHADGAELELEKDAARA